MKTILFFITIFIFATNCKAQENIMNILVLSNKDIAYIDSGKSKIFLTKAGLNKVKKYDATKLDGVKLEHCNLSFKIADMNDSYFASYPVVLRNKDCLIFEDDYFLYKSEKTIECKKVSNYSGLFYFAYALEVLKSLI